MNFTQSIKSLEESQDWLTDADLPALISLYAIAKELDDNGVTGSLIGHFGVAYRSLLQRAPKASKESTDPLALALQEVLN